MQAQVKHGVSKRIIFRGDVHVLRTSYEDIYCTHMHMHKHMDVYVHTYLIHTILSQVEQSVQYLRSFLEKNRINTIADVKRVSREIKILKRVRHPNVVALYEVLDTSSTTYFMMEHCDGWYLESALIGSQSSGGEVRSPSPAAGEAGATNGPPAFGDLACCSSNKPPEGHAYYIVRFRTKQ